MPGTRSDRRARGARGALAALVASAALVVWPGAAARAEPVRPADGAAELGARERLHVYAGMFGSGLLVAAQATDYRRGYLGHGGGGGIFAGVRLSRLFSVEANLRATVNGEHFARARVTNLPLDGLVVTTIGVGGRVHWPTSWIVEPYGHASAGYAIITADFVDCPDCSAVFATGPQAELGGGVDLHLGRRLSAGVRVAGQVMHFGSDSFEARFRIESVQPSETRSTILSVATDVYAMFHF
jgi:hypothetical protein